VKKAIPTIPLGKETIHSRKCPCANSSVTRIRTWVSRSKERSGTPSQIPVPPEPLYLGPGIAVDDIALVVLETPGDHDENIPFTDPDFFLDLALDPPQPGNTIVALDPDMVCSHHQFGLGKHLPVPLLGKADTDDLPGLVLLLIGPSLDQ